MTKFVVLVLREDVSPTKGGEGRNVVGYYFIKYPFSCFDF